MVIDYCDTDLLRDLKQDNISAFDTIYKFHSKPVYLYLLDKLKDQELCNDVLQDIFVALWEKRCEIEISTSFKSYLFQAARHKIIDIYRKDVRFKRYLFEFADELMADQFILINRIDHKRQLQEVEIAINNLPEKMKEIFILSRFQHQTTLDIARQKNISAQTVKNQISKALRILRMNYMGVDALLIFSAFLCSASFTC